MASQHREQMLGHVSTARGYGFNVPESAAVFDWPGLKARRDAYIHRLNGMYDTNWKKAGIEVVMGLGSFDDAHTVSVLNESDGSTRKLTAPHVMIAVGGQPTRPPIPGAEHCITSDGFFDLETQPKKVQMECIYLCVFIFARMRRCSPMLRSVYNRWQL